MIKIIREGKIDKQVLRFTCQNCGCIFEGEKGDYNWSYYQRDNEAICSIKCPCCGKWVQTVESYYGDYKLVERL